MTSSTPTLPQSDAVTLVDGESSLSLEDQRSRLTAKAALVILFSIQLFGLGLGFLPGGVPQLLYVVAFVTSGLALRPWRGPAALLVFPVSMTLLFTWFWASTSWAIAPSTSVKRVFLVSQIAFTIFAVVRQLGYRRALGMGRVMVGAGILVSVIVTLAIPSIGFQSAGGAADAGGGWRGLFIDKNAFGAFASFAALLFLFDGRMLFNNRPLSPYVRGGIVVLSLFCVFISGSKTSLGIVILVIPTAFLLGRFNPSYRMLLIPLAVFAAVGVYLMWGKLIAPFSEALYDPRAFTGRGLIWGPVWNYSRDHPWLGAGYGSFWSIGTDSPIYTYTLYTWVQKGVAQSHNGYLEMLATVGSIGLALAVIAGIAAPLAKLVWTRALASKPDQKALCASIILFCVGNNLTEATLFNRDTFLNSALLFAVALVCQAIREAVGQSQRLGPPPRWNPRRHPAMGAARMEPPLEERSAERFRTSWVTPSRDEPTSDASRTVEPGSRGQL
jgi:O-antigen ligase